MPRWRYTVTDPVPTHLMCTAKIVTISITAKNKTPQHKSIAKQNHKYKFSFVINQYKENTAKYI